MNILGFIIDNMSRITINFLNPPYYNDDYKKQLLIDFVVELILREYLNVLMLNLYDTWFRFKLEIHQEEIIGRLRQRGYIVVKSNVCDLHLGNITDDQINPCPESSCSGARKHSIFFINLNGKIDLSLPGPGDFDLSLPEPDPEDFYLNLPEPKYR